MPRIIPLALLFALGLVACGSSDVPTPNPSPIMAGGRADVGGYELAYECRGEGEPTVILEAGLGAAGTEEFFGFLDQIAAVTRVCTTTVRAPA
jgi:hypothetical protein